MLAQRLGAWVPLDEVPDVWDGRHLDLPRLRLPPAAQPGPAEVPRRRLGRGEVPRGARDAVPRSARCSTARRRRRSPRARATTSASTRSATAGSTSAPRRPSAAVSGTILARLADLAEAHGSGRVRLTAQQKLVILDVPPDRGRGARRRAATRSGLQVRPQRVPPRHHGLHRHRVLQARDRRDQGHRPAPWSPSSRTAPSRRSTPRCRSTSTAARTRAPASRSPTSASRGCSCPTPTGSPVEGFQVHLGGALGHDAGFGRKLRGLKVDRRRAARLRRARSPGATSSSAPRASSSPPGSLRADEEALR